MDPYLEGPLWTSAHAQLIAEIARQLAPRLRARYLALTERRFVVVSPDPEDAVTLTATDIYPDVDVSTAARRPHEGMPAGVPAPLRLETLMPAAVPHFTVE